MMNIILLWIFPNKIVVVESSTYVLVSMRALHDFVIKIPFHCYLNYYIIPLPLVLKAYWRI